MLDWIRTIWDYNYWATHKLLECVQTISDDDFTKPVPYSIGSVHQQVVHVMWAEALWYAQLHNFPRPAFTAQDYATLLSIREKWDTIEAQWRDYILHLTEHELHRNINAVSPSGNPYILTVTQVLIHVVNHGTNHRAQILQILHGYGGKTFEQDLAFYFREKKGIT